jgi:transcriptional regulator GlxA family with amidase domain
MHKQRPTVGILLFDDVEVLDFCGPFEVFSTARLVDADKQGDEHGLLRVCTIAEQDRILSCRGNLLVQPHMTMQQHPPLDILVVQAARVRDASGRIGACSTGSDSRISAHN